MNNGLLCGIICKSEKRDARRGFRLSQKAGKQRAGKRIDLLHFAATSVASVCLARVGGSLSDACGVALAAHFAVTVYLKEKEKNDVEIYLLP